MYKLANKDPEACGDCQRKNQPGSPNIEDRILYEVALLGEENIQVCRDCLRKMRGKPVVEHPDWRINADRWVGIRGEHASGFTASLDRKNLRVGRSNKKSHPELKTEKLIQQLKAIATEWGEQWRFEERARDEACLTDCYRSLEKEIAEEIAYDQIHGEGAWLRASLPGGCA